MYNMTAEREMWKTCAEREAADGCAVVKERDAYLENLTATQARCTALLEETRALKARIKKLEDAEIGVAVDCDRHCTEAEDDAYERAAQECDRWHLTAAADSIRALKASR